MYWVLVLYAVAVAVAWAIGFSYGTWVELWIVILIGTPALAICAFIAERRR